MRVQLLAFTVTALLSSSLLVVAACGSSSNGTAPIPDASGDTAVGTDTGALPDTGTTPEAGPIADGGVAESAAPATLAFPLVNSSGVPQMTSPKVVTITFSGDTMTADLQGFGATVTQSTWWSTVIADYCPADAGGCKGQTGVNDALTTSAASSYVDTATGDPTQLPDGGVPIWNVLTTEIAAARVPPPDLNTLYMIYLPSTSSVSLDGAPSCGNGGFDGYHNQTTYTANGTTVPVIYGVSAECSGYQLSDVTLTSSHEIAEAATDGYFDSSGNGGYYLDVVASDPNTFAWNDIAGGEVGDLCVDFLGAGQDHTPEGTYTAQRIWSISQAALVKDPCIPTNGSVYFNAYPEKSFFVMNVGDTRTVTVSGFSDATHADWWVSGQDVTQASDSAQYLQVTLPSAATINNGKTLEMTIKLLADPSMTTQSGEADGLLFSADNASLMSATHGNYWPFAVMTTATAQSQHITEPSHLRRRGPRVHRVSPLRRH